MHEALSQPNPTQPNPTQPNPTQPNPPFALGVRGWPNVKQSPGHASYREGYRILLQVQSTPVPDWKQNKEERSTAVNSTQANPVQTAINTQQNANDRRQTGTLPRVLGLGSAQAQVLVELTPVESA